jgi:hypothetical protein
MELIKKHLHTISLAGIAYDVTENICTKYITLEYIRLRNSLIDDVYFFSPPFSFSYA